MQPLHKTGEPMPYVKDIVTKLKLNSISTIKGNNTVYEALVKMAKINTGALIVVEDGVVSGIFSERDYARKIILNNKNSSATLVREVMTSDVIFVGMDNSLDECMRAMTKRGIRHLPVLSNGSLKAFISMTDIVACIVEDKDFHILQLTQYITGTRTSQNKLWHTA